MKVAITAYGQEAHVGIYDANGEQEGGAYSPTPDGLLRLVVGATDIEGNNLKSREYIVNLDRGSVTEV